MSFGYYTYNNGILRSENANFWKRKKKVFENDTVIVSM